MRPVRDFLVYGKRCEKKAITHAPETTGPSFKGNRKYHVLKDVENTWKMPSIIPFLRQSQDNATEVKIYITFHFQTWKKRDDTLVVRPQNNIILTSSMNF